MKAQTTPLIKLLALLVLLVISQPVRADLIPGFYLSDANRGLHRMNLQTGQLTTIGQTSVLMRDIAFSPTGGLFGVSDTDTLYTINPQDASVTLIGALGVPLSSGLTFSSDGTLFMSSAPSPTNGSLYTVDTLTGVASFVGQIGFASNGDLAFDPSGRLFMTATNFTTQFNLVEIDPNTGLGTLIGPHGFGNTPAMDFAAGQLLGINTQGQVVTIDQLTGMGTLLFTTNPIINATGAAFTMVPEPNSIILLGSILLAITGFKRMRSRD